MIKGQHSRDGDLFGRQLGSRLGERNGKHAVLHRRFDFFGLNGADVSRLTFKHSDSRSQLTLMPCGSWSVRENFPNRRSLTTYPSSFFSVDMLLSAETVKRPLCTSMWTSSFLNPGNSKEATTELFFASSWRSILFVIHSQLYIATVRRRVRVTYLGGMIPEVVPIWRWR